MKPATVSALTALLTFLFQAKIAVSFCSPSPALSSLSQCQESSSTITRLHALNSNDMDRRESLIKFAFGAATSAFVSAAVTDVPPAFAAAAVPTKEELDRIKIGHDQISYLLNNFEQETTVCRENGGECKRDADSVRKALGLRSTTDPLFQIEKVFAKVKNMDIDPDKLEAFFEATEDWNTTVNMSNSMAFISQFGEYNPGGGKDEVLKYLEESRKQVVLAEKALKTIMDCLDIPV